MSNERDSALSYLDAGHEYLLRSDWSSATQAFRTAVRLDPQLPKAHAGLGAALGNQGLWQLAIEAHRVALMFDPGDLDVLYNLAVAYAELERPVEAEEGFRRVVSARPGDHETLVRLGVVLAEQSRSSEALEQFQTVALAEPVGTLTAAACAYASAALRELGRTDEARVAFARARELDGTLFEERPEFAQLWIELEGG